MANKRDPKQFIPNWIMGIIEKHYPVIDDRYDNVHNEGENANPIIEIIIDDKTTTIQINGQTPAGMVEEEKIYKHAITYKEIKEIIERILNDHEYIKTVGYDYDPNLRSMNGCIEWGFNINWTEKSLKGISCNTITLSIKFNTNIETQRLIVRKLYTGFFQRIKKKLSVETLQALACLLGEEALLVKNYEVGEKRTLDDSITVGDYLSALNPGLSGLDGTRELCIDIGILENSLFPRVQPDDNELISESSCRVEKGKLYLEKRYNVKNGKATNVSTSTLPLNDSISAYCGMPVKEFLKTTIAHFEIMQSKNQRIAEAREKAGEYQYPPLVDYKQVIENFRELLRRVNGKQTDPRKSLARKSPKQN